MEDHIQIADLHIQAFGNFGLQIIGNVNQVCPKPLAVPTVTNLAGVNAIFQRHILINLRFIEGNMNGEMLGSTYGIMDLLCFTLYSKASTYLQGSLLQT